MAPRSMSRTLVATGAFVGVLTAIFFILGIFEPLESKLYDHRVRGLPAQQTQSMVVLLVPGQGSFSATEAADLITMVEDSGAAVIAFNEPISGSGTELDPLVARAVEHGAVVFAYRHTEPDALADLASGRIPQGLESNAYTGTVGADPRIEDASVALGFNARAADADGVLRRFTPTLSSRPEIAVAAASVRSRGVIELPRTTPVLGERTLVGPGPRLLIPYRKSQAAITPSQLVDLELSDTGIIIGRQEGVTWKTPLGVMTDAEVTQQIASALIERRGITRAPTWMVVIALIAVSTALVTGGLRPTAWLDLLLPLAVAVLVYMVASVAFRTGTWVDTVPLLFAMAAHVVAVTFVSAGMRRSIAQLKRTGRQERVFFRGFLETMIHAALAESGRAWLKIDEHFVDRASTADIPDHILQLVPAKGVTESYRDEGQFVLLGFHDGHHDGGLALLRPRSLSLSPERLELISRCSEPFVRRIEDVRAGDLTPPILDALRDVAVILDEKDHFPRDHPEKIAALAVAIATKMGLSESELHAIETAAYLHDLGKIGVPDALIDTKERLTDEEYERVKGHTTITESILRAFGLEDELIAVCGAHHERWDGRGYPRRLAGAAIPLGARILAVADTITSMIADRPYRNGMSLDIAMEEVVGQRGRMFDPQVVKAVTELVAEDRDIVVSKRLRPSA